MICPACRGFLYAECPKQIGCGEILCRLCFKQLSISDPFPCPCCKDQISVSECFDDKASWNEFKKSKVACTNLGCSWKGTGDKYAVHFDNCPTAVLNCSFAKYGCRIKYSRSQMTAHEKECSFRLCQHDCRIDNDKGQHGKELQDQGRDMCWLLALLQILQMGLLILMIGVICCK